MLAFADKTSFRLCSSLLGNLNPSNESRCCTKTNIPFPRSCIKFAKKDELAIKANVALSRDMVQEHLRRSVIVKKQSKEVSKEVDFVRTLLIDNYDSYTYNIYQELSVVNGGPPFVVRNDEWTWEEAYYYLYEARAFDNIVISPGPGSPVCPADIGLCLYVLHECHDIPILGVCLGHQALGYVHGGKIVLAPEPIHGRLSEIEHNGCRLFDNIPSGKNSGFKVVRYHSLVLEGEKLPSELVPIAWTSVRDALPFLQKADQVYNHSAGCGEASMLSGQISGTAAGKVLMGVMHSSWPHYGLQFHPESVATSYGRQIFRNFRDLTVDYWQAVSSKNRNARMQMPNANSCRTSFRGDQFAEKKNGHCNGYVVNNSKSGIAVRNLRLKWKILNGLASRVGGSRIIFDELYGKSKAQDTFWLDSSTVEKGRARFSIMGGRGGSLWKQLTFKLSSSSDAAFHYGGLLSIEDVQGVTSTVHLERGFFDFLENDMRSICCDKKDYEGLPFDFCGGYIGYLGYNLKVECGAAFNHHRSSSPDACFFFADNFLVIDHRSNDVYIMSLFELDKASSSWLDDAEKRLLDLQASSNKNAEDNPSMSALASPFEAGFVSEKSREQYLEDVGKCLEYIKSGQSYELCLTTQLRKRITDLAPIDLYMSLREKNPAPYAAWLNFSKHKLSICSSSPERFLRLDRDEILEAKPIKGTSPRGSSSHEDEQLKLLLQYSEKDQAENLMIVDLLRNDLGRVCEPGSVNVPHLMEVETYATVHTMVSTVRGKRRGDVSPVECVRAAFPGGSMTGAPKLRSMEILDSLESCSRGIYSGSIGYFSINSTFDLNIVIRTVVMHDGEASIGAGGAVVALSNPEDEYNEMILKTSAPIKAIVECETTRCVI